MSTALLPATRDSPSIAPHLLHSPSHAEIQHIMHDYRDTTHNSPDELYYPPSPVSPPIAASITSPSGMLVVHSYGPASGPPGAPLTAQVDFRNFSSTGVHLRIVFGDLALPTTVVANVPSPEREAVLGQERGNWNLKIFVPPVGQASIHMAEPRPDGRPEWPLTLQAIDSSGNLLDTIGFGFFIYEDGSDSPKSRSHSPNKHARSDDDLDSPPTPTKRLATNTEAMNIRRMSVASADSYLGSRQAPTANRVLIDVPSPAPSQTLPAVMHVHSHVYPHHLQLQTEPSPQHMPPETYAVQSTREEYSDDGPALIRTTQISSGGGKSGSKSAQASVAIQRDLESMKHGWSDAERLAGRRLVQFWKQQIGTTLHISFGAIPQHQYTDNTIVVSCIYRKHQYSPDEYFITSVDVIYLLEALAGNRFEVEEKNRIRRNLEGFKPVTISKSKAGTEEFFRAIMEFAAPKPRNIEKDVKVFSWEKLKMMLEKVFSKYSTVPMSPNNSSSRYDSIVTGRTGNIYPFPSKGTAEHHSSNQQSHRATRSRSPGVHRKLSPGPTSCLQEAHKHTSLPITHTVEHTYAEPFVPAKYPEALDFNASIEPGVYSFGVGGMHFDMSSGINPGVFKVDTSSSGGSTNETIHMNGAMGVAHVGPDMGRQLNGFRSASPLSSDNSPISMSLSLSSGASSDGGHAESQGTAGVSLHDPEHLTCT